MCLAFSGRHIADQHKGADYLTFSSLRGDAKPLAGPR
jgi:hypothetical protein